MSTFHSKTNNKNRNKKWAVHILPNSFFICGVFLGFKKGGFCKFPKLQNDKYQISKLKNETKSIKIETIIMIENFFITKSFSE